MWTRKGCHYIPQVDLCQGMYRAWIAFRHPVVFRPGHGSYCYANADNLKLDFDPNLVGVLPSNPPEAMSHTMCLPPFVITERFAGVGRRGCCGTRKT